MSKGSFLETFQELPKLEYFRWSWFAVIGQLYRPVMEHYID